MLCSAGPLPRFDGLAVDTTVPNSGDASSPTTAAAPIRVPPLNPDDVNKFTSLFDKSDVNRSGVLSGILWLLPLRLMDRASATNRSLTYR